MRAIFLLIAVVSLTFPQSERGAIPVVNYTNSGDYRADRDAWVSVRSHSGLMYFGNSEGLLRYNGVTWKLFPLPHRTSIQSMVIDRRGRIIIGSDNEIGIMTEAGETLRYTSLTHLIPESLRTFSQTWTADTLGEYSYLQSTQAVFVVENDTVHTIPAAKEFGLTYRYNGRLLVQERLNGLMELKGTRLLPFDSSSFFRTKSISYIFPAAQKKHFVFTKYDGIFLYDGRTVTPVRSPLNDLMMKHRPYRGTMLSTGENAIGVIGFGLIIFDSAGTIQSVINKENGLKASTVTSVYDDLHGNIWLTCYEGIVRFLYPAPVTHFSEKQGITGTSKITVRHRGTIYAGSISSLFVLKEDPAAGSLAHSGTRSVFSAINAVREDCSFMMSVDDDLLVSTTQGVFAVNNKGNRLITRTYALPLHRSSADPNRVFIGTFGLGSMVRKDGAWIDEGLYEGITEDVYQVFEERPDVLWLRTYNQGIMRVTLRGGSSRAVSAERFGIADGLPSLSFLPASMVEGRFIVPTESGLYSFNEEQKRFQPDTLFRRQFPGVPDGLYAVDPGKNGSYWLFFDRPEGYALELWKRGADGLFHFEPLPFVLPPQARMEYVMEDDDGVCWITTTNGIYRYDPNLPKFVESSFRAVIDRMELSLSDSVIGAVNDGVVQLRHRENSMKFTFSANSYLDERQTMYQYLLEGFESDWSAWNSENHKEYTNLDPGSYTFRVRAKNPLGTVSAESRQQLVITPPWWGTWWFRSIMGLLFLTVGPFYYYRRVSALKRENEIQENFSRQLINRQESERKRIAHELHDSISQSLLSIKSRASMAVERPDEQQWMLDQLNVILSSSSGAIQEIKQITHNLRPYLLDRVGLTKALQSLMRTFSESSVIRLIGMVDEIDGKLPQENEIHLYRIMQEALNNVQKHSSATQVTASVEDSGGSILLTIRDDGKGFDPSAVRPDNSTLGGLGLGGITERVQILNGEFVIESRPGRGTAIIITIPLKEHHV